MFTSARRPTRAVIEQLIRETGGNMTRLAGRLGVSRQTAYQWIYMADLADVVGIRPREDSMPEKGNQARAPLPEGARVAVTVRIDAALWRAVRIRALEEDRPASDVVEDAARVYLAAVRGPKP